MARNMDAKSGPPISVQVVDPPAWTPPYDHSLSAALARAGAAVELVTTDFPLATVPAGEGYTVSTRFYRGSSRLPGADSSGRLVGAARRGLKLAEHVPDMVGYRRHARRAEVVHLQW